MKVPLWRPRQKQELDQEIRSHLEESIHERIERGASREQAEAAARREFGNVIAVTETTRDMWGWAWLDRLAQDLRYGLRMLSKHPAFTAVAVLTLALGIGANSAIFSVINAALLRPLPVAAPERLVALNNAGQQRGFPTFSYPNYRDLRDQNRTLADLIAYRFAPVSLSHAGVNQRVWGTLVSGNYFAALGVRPQLGRLIGTADDLMPDSHPVAVLSYNSWHKRFGGRRDLIGRDLIVNGRGYQVIGVAPDGFSGTETIAAPEIWFPIAMQSAIEIGADWLEQRDREPLLLQGRLKSGVTPAAAQADLNAIARRLAREFPDANQGLEIELSKAGLVGKSLRGAAVGFAALLMAVVGLVLLLACTNLANLLLARATERRQEIAVRMALGASRGRLMRQLVTESLLLAAAAGAVGLAPVLWPVQLRVQLRPPIDFPIALEVRSDPRVLLFAALLTIVTGLLFGLLPAWRATQAQVAPVLKGGEWFAGRRPSWTRGSVIVLQVALSLVLLIAGGLMLRALRQAQTLDLGFVPEHAVEVTFDLRLQGYDEARGRALQQQLVERVRELPIVQAAGLADLVPVDLHFAHLPVFIAGAAPQRSANAPVALTSRISPGYLQAMGTALLAGSDFSDHDVETSVLVAIVNQTFAERFWPGENPIGKRFSLGDPNEPKLHVVGIAQDGKYSGLGEDPKPFVYRSLWQSYSGSTSVVVRGRSGAQSMIAAVRRELRRLDPQMPIAAATPLGDRLKLALLPARIAATLLGAFALLGLVLAAVGIYGLISYAVSRRTQELGVRMALGARKRDVLRLVIGQGMRPALLGILLGWPAAFALTRLMKSVLYGVSATDPLTYIAVAALLTAVALLACYLPARRATQVDPITALRYE
ncbi:MAG TPA: ABC transporter permease [Acidobacteriota bacterium]